MPNRFLDAPATGGVPQPPVGNRFLGGVAAEDTVPTATEESGGSWLPVVAGGAALAGAGVLAAKMPGKIGAAARGLNALRQQLMLSGMALPKSMLGNAGAALTQSIERGSMRPLAEMFSGETVKDAVRAYRAHGSAGPTPGVNLPGPVPGRIMGAFDDAAQKALVRGGASPKEATNEVLQTPLGENFGRMGDVLETPLASYMHPFRRTPFNQFIEGYKAVDKAVGGDQGARRALGAYGAAGAVHGAATADDNMPLSVPIAMSGAGRYGLPYGIAALVSRGLMGGKGASGIAGSALPVSEYGFEQSLNDPLKPFVKPAAFSALERLTGK